MVVVCIMHAYLKASKNKNKYPNASVNINICVKFVIERKSCDKSGQADDESHKLNAYVEVKPPGIPFPTVSGNNGSNWKQHTPSHNR